MIFKTKQSILIIYTYKEEYSVYIYVFYDCYRKNNLSAFFDGIILKIIGKQLFDSILNATSIISFGNHRICLIWLRATCGYQANSKRQQFVFHKLVCT